jgi:hypothetical protein
MPEKRREVEAEGLAVTGPYVMYCMWARLVVVRAQQCRSRGKEREYTQEN